MTDLDLMFKVGFGRLCKHFGLMVGLTIMGLQVLFWGILPAITRAGKLVVVPNLIGCTLQEVEKIIQANHLRLLITDNKGYSSRIPAHAVLQQYPAKGAEVKINRRIHVTLNAAHPPLVSMPNLLEGSIRQAKLLLHNKGLKLGKIQQVPDIAHAVLEQWYKGEPIEPGKMIHQGEAIDLVVGMGLSKQMGVVPDLLNMSLEEATLILLEHGMRIGIVHRQKNPQVAIGTILQQQPLANTKVPLGTAINLWLVDF